VPEHHSADSDTRRWLDAALNRHREYRAWTLNLIASENVMSPAVARYYDLELGHRYGNYEGLDTSNRKYTGNRYLAELEKRALADACALFHAAAADLRALSGHVAGSAVILGLCRAGDLVMELNDIAGGHRLAEKLAKARLVDLRVEAVPFDGAAMQVDAPATVKRIAEAKPRLVILGSSNYLFPTPLSDIAAACHAAGARLIVDAAHVLGLIAGGQFPQPLDDGADLVVSSTHKTLAGPQGGIILARSADILDELLPALYPGLVTNHHLMRIPAMIALFAEWRGHGEAYARAIVANAVGLAGELAALGVPVVTTALGPTRSHTLLIKTRGMGRSAADLTRRLEAAGVLVTSCKLPAEQGGEGLRLGVQELTRRGLAAPGLPPLAEIVKAALTTDAPESLIPRVKAYTAGFDKVHFCDEW